ncbi:type I restriction-modification system subunit M [Intestinimonas butyriciproducens]|uniref:type I restriction-modification system subunit M n=1 Tax=Intestinimonas butyriciproducens TaxID=1297617 RepID=UPI00195B5C8B|nr:class I SAM-dependent DNA methyltransferase [Intestinimonas butyriciproducens]MBM6974306.1 SAM-dependent DNA methyltransferase [Intestinimonas butyriciproducens]
MSLSANVSEKAALIWAIADKLTGVYKPHEYGEVILPLTVIRRFDCILADTKDAVLEKFEAVKNLPMRDVLLRKASGKAFYNTSKFTFERLLDDPDNIEANFRDYLNGFSENVQDILEKFKFDGQITTMANKGILCIVIKEFTTPKANLHPDVISNLEMGYIFEEIIRRFSESHNEDAGQHYTPREVIQLMVNILFYDDNDMLSGNNVVKTIYDPACGTGGMLSVAEEYLHQLNASTELMAFGQELNDQTFAICKADMLIKGNNADFIKDGNTLSDDQFEGQTFDYVLSNPPFGREWKNEKATVEAEAKRGFAGRFGPGLPAASDGQMLFLLTAISKMKEPKDGGSRIAIIHNGSPLFTGDAGSGPSEIRKYILENDLLEAIIALPNDIFYNTGIATYIWVLSNKKAGTRREGRVQLINANGLYEKRRKALGNKRNDIPESAIQEITWLYGDFVESEISKIFDTADFGYTKITVERPLRYNYSTEEKRIQRLSEPDVLDDLRGEGEYNPPYRVWQKILRTIDQNKKFDNRLDFYNAVKDAADLAGYSQWMGNFDIIEQFCREEDNTSEVVLKRGKPVPSSAKRDTENVPLKEDIQTYFEREVLPFAPDAWIDEKKSKVGYEIPFTRYFYKYEAPKPSAEIMQEILAIEAELDGALAEVFEA